MPEMPVKSQFVSVYPKLSEIYSKLEEQNKAIYQREYQLAGLEKEINSAKGIFKAKQRKELQEKAEYLRVQIANMKQRLSGIVRDYGYKNVQEFMAEYKIAKIKYNEYKTAFSEWEQEMEYRAKERQIAEKYQQQYRKTEERKKNYDSYYFRNSREEWAMEKYIIGENGIGYTIESDGLYYPNLQLPEGTQYEIGRYGFMRQEYLQTYHRRDYIRLIMEGKLNEHLHEVDEECHEKIELLMEQMQSGAGVTEELKAKDQMKWVGLMNNLRSSAEEIVIKEFIQV